MRILHIADVHLDRPFVDLGAADARARRAEVRDTFRRALKIGEERNVDLITIGGDLWEDENVAGASAGRVSSSESDYSRWSLETTTRSLRELASGRLEIRLPISPAVTVACAQSVRYPPPRSALAARGRAERQEGGRSDSRLCWMGRGAAESVDASIDPAGCPSRAGVHRAQRRGCRRATRDPTARVGVPSVATGDGVSRNRNGSAYGCR
jgi:hypothetical protein